MTAGLLLGLAVKDRGRVRPEEWRMTPAGLAWRIGECEATVKDLTKSADELIEALTDQMAIKFTEAETRVTGLVNRVVKLEHSATVDAGARLAANDAGVVARQAMDKATTAWQQFGALPDRVRALETRQVELGVDLDNAVAMAKADFVDYVQARLNEQDQAREGLRKRTSEKFSLRDGKLAGLAARVTDLEAAKPRKKVA